MAVSTVDELKNIIFLLVQRLSIHAESLMRWFNSNLSHRSFTFLLENDIY